jgi:tetratricopeptide (TPR) repeat protein
MWSRLFGKRARPGTAPRESGPVTAEQWSERAERLREEGHLGDAVHAYERAIALGGPKLPLYTPLGTLYLSQGRYPEAVELFTRMAAEEPTSADAWCLLGAALQSERRYEAAIGKFERALELQPTHPQAHFNLGLARFERGDLEGASASFARCAALRRGEPWGPNPAADLARPHRPEFEPMDMAVNEVKVGHDCEQLAYLLDLGRLPEAFREVLDDYRSLFGELRGRVDAYSLVPLDTQRHPLVARTYKRPMYIAPAAIPEGPLIRPELDGRELEDRYLAAMPNLVVCDGLLTPGAMQALRAFCRESTFWNNIKPGYLGSYFYDGFCSQLLLRLAWELRDRLPRVIRDHPLQMMWGYKCDPTLPGLGIHADEAAVNVNFWLTEDEANLDPQHGGLIIHTHQAPGDWGFARFNNDSRAVQDYLASVGSIPVCVPYRSNRAVIFDSDLFHATDQPRFREGYLNRRINVTLLYGSRAG